MDMGSFGTHTLRIANKSTPSECNNSDFSETSCGFVVEFKDIITKKRMNQSSIYDSSNGLNNKGGWEYCEIRTYVNTDIYNALPIELKNGIIDTKVISGYGQMDSNNFITIDKLYLLAPHEILDDENESTVYSYDTSYNQTRQLDYYQNNNVINVDNPVLDKYNNSNIKLNWWLRSAYPIWNYSYDNNNYFFSVGSNLATGCHNVYGISPAFRIG